MKQKKKNNHRGFAGIPRHVMDHPDYINLSGSAIKLLLNLCYQYKGNNNGNLTAAWTIQKKCGFKSKATLSKALNELVKAGMIVCTREGKFINPGGVCSLYALTWQAIDECKGKNIELKPTTKPYRQFSLEKYIKTPSTVSGSIEGFAWYRNCTST